MKYLSDYLDNELADAFNKYGAFFAFGDKQLNEQKKEGVMYVSCGAGLFCPKSNFSEFNDTLTAIFNNAIKQDVKENGASGIIEREYFNHETQISGDCSDLRDSLKPYAKDYPELFSEEIINDVCKKSFQLAIEKDWF